MLEGKKIIVGVTGSIAAYKIPMLVRLLVKAGAEVKVVMTKSAGDFVSPLTLSTLSKNQVITDFAENSLWTNHVMLGRWADIMIIAPLSCNTLAKISSGLCDNLLMAVYLSATCPVVVVPAMDEDMWKHPSTKNNILQIENRGNKIIPVGTGELASGLSGEGRMAEVEDVYQWVLQFFSDKEQLKGKNVLVTAGPTHEAIDPVRFIGNYSSGKMGLAITKELKNRGANVTLVLGPSSIKIPDGIKVVHVHSAEEMFAACDSHFASMDIAIMSAAVADYTPLSAKEEKIKKTGDSLILELKKTRDILKHLGSIKKDHQMVVGFALETNDGEEYAIKKLEEKNADLIVLNQLKDKGAGFGYDTNKITIFGKGGKKIQFDLKSKEAVATDIINVIIKSYHEVV
jgi:phosphopantothenoylcysteine decarboxylase/phosphopantothenate--cysteine ligase